MALTPYDLDVNKSALHKEYMSFVFYGNDPWGSHHTCLYDACAFMVFNGIPVPEEFGFSPGCDDCTDAKDDWYLYGIAEDATFEDLMAFAQDLHINEEKAREDGLSY